MLNQYWKPSAECKQYADMILMIARAIGQELTFDNLISLEKYFIMKVNRTRGLDSDILVTISGDGETIESHKAPHDCFELKNTWLMIQLVNAIQNYIKTNRDEFNEFWQLLSFMTNPYNIVEEKACTMQVLAIRMMFNALRDAVNKSFERTLVVTKVYIDDYFRRSIVTPIIDNTKDIHIACYTDDQLIFDYINGKYIVKLEGVKFDEWIMDMIQAIEMMLNKYPEAAKKLYIARETHEDLIASSIG